MYAASLGNPRVTQMLLDKNADKSTMDDNGKTALMLAMEQGFPQVVKLLQDPPPTGGTSQTTSPSKSVWAQGLDFSSFLNEKESQSDKEVILNYLWNMVVSSSGKFLVSGWQDHRVRLWSLATKY
jgi:ankyrin repeat protein